MDTLNGSRHKNMKELRFDADGGVWRAAFIFDPRRTAVLLLVANKRGLDQKRLYRDLLNEADRRYAKYLQRLDAKDD